jgi:hypothetical protein
MVDEVMMPILASVCTVAGVVVSPSMGGSISAGSCSNVNRHVFHRALCVVGKANPNIPPSVRNSTGRSVKLDILAGVQFQKSRLFCFRKNECQHQP